MKKEFIPYEQALELYELGFDEPCFGWFDTGYLRVGNVESKHIQGLGELLAPLYQQAFRWFREKYDLFGCIDLQACTPSHWYIRIDKIEINDYLYHSEDEHLRFNTYEEAELSCLEKLIEIVKSNTKSP
jgi:hypothetical protein